MRAEMSKTIYPVPREKTFFDAGKSQLIKQLSAAGMNSAPRRAALGSLAPTRVPGSGSVYLR